MTQQPHADPRALVAPRRLFSLSIEKCAGHVINLSCLNTLSLPLTPTSAQIQATRAQVTSNMDTQKIQLLRSYSRITIISTSYNDGFSSASGLEKFLPRTSTPDPDKYFLVDNKDCFDSYEIFRHVLENPPKKVRVRGMKNVPFDFISGHLVDFNNSRRIATFHRKLKTFFRKCFKILARKKCDYACPMTCECQKIKSFLNKTQALDDDSLED
ncbi:uncharacterized protein LOC103313164 [Tribolium castaneum]